MNLFRRAVCNISGFANFKYSHGNRLYSAINVVRAKEGFRSLTLTGTSIHAPPIHCLADCPSICSSCRMISVAANAGSSSLGSINSHSTSPRLQRLLIWRTGVIPSTRRPVSVVTLWTCLHIATLQMISTSAFLALRTFLMLIVRTVWETSKQ